MVCWGRRHDVILYEAILYIYILWCVGGADRHTDIIYGVLGAQTQDMIWCVVDENR